MRARAPIAVVVLLALALVPAVAFAQTISPNDPSSGRLVETPKEFDGKTIAFTGEAVGEAMFRGDGAWVHVNDDAYYEKNVEEGAELGGYNSGQAFWAPAAEARRIATFGDYKHEGDIVKIVGVFNAACAQHGGDMDVHAESIEVLVEGHPVVDPIHPFKIVLAIALWVVAAAAWWISRMLSERSERGAPA